MKNKIITAEDAQFVIDGATGYWRRKLAAMWAMSIVLGDSVEIPNDLYEEIRNDSQFDQVILNDIFGNHSYKVSNIEIGECILHKQDHKDALILRTSIGFVDLHELGWGVTNINPLTTGEKVNLHISYDLI